MTRGTEAPPVAAQVRGPASREGGGSDWSDDAIDFALLGLADAELTLSADRIVNKDVKIGPSRLAVKLDNKVAKVTLQDMQLYDGRGRGTLTLDGSGQVPVMGANFAYEGISAQPFLKDAMGFDWLEGRSTITIALAGQGASERQMIESLNGKVDMTTINGAIAGVDVDKVLSNIERGRLDFSTSPAREDAFQRVRRQLHDRQWRRSEQRPAAREPAGSRDRTGDASTSPSGSSTTRSIPRSPAGSPSPASSI